MRMNKSARPSEGSLKSVEPPRGGGPPPSLKRPMPPPPLLSAGRPPPRLLPPMKSSSRNPVGKGSGKEMHEKLVHHSPNPLQSCAKILIQERLWARS